MATGNYGKTIKLEIRKDGGNGLRKGKYATHCNMSIIQMRIRFVKTSH